MPTLSLKDDDPGRRRSGSPVSPWTLLATLHGERERKAERETERERKSDRGGDFQFPSVLLVAADKRVESALLDTDTGMRRGSDEGSYLRLRDVCIAQLL